MTDSEIDRQAESHGVGPKLTLRPTILVAWGATGQIIARRFEARLKARLGALPPFFSLVTILPQEKTHRIIVSDGVEGESEFEWKPSEAEGEGEWLTRAIERVSDSRRGPLPESLPRIARPGGPLEIIAVASLDELNDLESLTGPFSELGSDLSGCRRVALLWTGLRDSRRQRERCKTNLAQLDRVQSSARGLMRTNAFEVCFLQSPRMRNASVAQRTESAAEASVSFLWVTTASALAPSIQRLTIPQPGPYRFHLGIAESVFDPGMLLDALGARWRAYAFQLLSHASDQRAAPEYDATVADEISVEALSDLDLGDVRRRLEQHRLHAWENAVEVGSKETHEGFLVSVSRTLVAHLEDVRRQRYSWACAKDRWYRQLARWELKRPPLKQWTGSKEVTRVQRRPWALVAAGIAALAAILANAEGATQWAWLGGLLSLALLAVFLLARRAKRVFLPMGVLPNPVYEAHVEEGARLRRLWERARWMTGDGSLEDGQDPHGLVQADLMLSARIAELESITERLRHAQPEEEVLESHSMETFTSEDVALLLRYFLQQSDTGWDGESETRAVDHQLQAEMKPADWVAILRGGYDALIEALENVRRKTLQGLSSLTPQDYFEYLSQARGGGEEGLYEFFAQLSSQASIQWKLGPEVSAAEATFLLHAEPWTAALALDPQRPSAEVQRVADPERGRIAMLRLARGSCWELTETPERDASPAT